MHTKAAALGKDAHDEQHPAWVTGPRLLVEASLEQLAVVMIQLGDAGLATRVLGGAAALRAQLGSPVRPVNQPDVDHMLATARALLGPDAFDEL